MISPKSIENLRKSVSFRLSEKRYMHTLGVERAAIFLAQMCLPQKKDELRAAALLHDITKELSQKEQLQILEACSYPLSEFDRSAVQVLHSLTAPYVILRDFPDFATDEILSAVEKHTLADKEMTVFDEILFLADFIEDTRENDSSIEARKYVFDSMREGEYAENLKILHKACLFEINSTILYLTNLQRQIHPKTLEAKDGLISKI